ncbi:MAG: hypothetical protein QM756_28355 [Polyangiaceae bacterium]
MEKAVLNPNGEQEEAEEVSGSELAERLAERLSLTRGSSFKDVVG